MRDGIKFPPVHVFRVDDRFILVDGHHRILAARLAGIKEILCEVHVGSIRDAILYSCGVNFDYGLPRTIEDKTLVVKRLITDPEWGHWSDRQIAKICNVSQPFVGKCRVNRTGRTDNVIITDSPLPENEEKRGAKRGAGIQKKSTYIFQKGG